MLKKREANSFNFSECIHKHRGNMPTGILFVLEAATIRGMM